MNPIDRTPSMAVRAAFRAQASEETTAAALRCAALELQRLRHLGLEPLWEAHDLLHQVLEATWSGRLTWDPDAVPLRIHIRDAMHDLARRARDPERMADATVALDHVDDEHPVHDDPALALPALGHTHLIDDLAQRFEAEMWTLVRGDQLLLRVLSVMIEGHTSDGEIAAATGLSLAVAKRSRRRLLRLASTATSSDLVADIREALHERTSREAA